MAQLQVPEAPREYATHYRELLGVDYRADQTEVDRRRSPDMVNMISDLGGNPVKRDGYRRVGIGYAAIVVADGATYGVYVSDINFAVSKLELDGYEFNETEKTVFNYNIGTVKSTFVYRGDIYIVATNAFVRFNTADKSLSLVGIGANMMSAGTVGEDEPVYDGNIPDVVIGLKPDGTAGTVLDDKNVFSIYQRVNYQGDGSSTTFKIPNYTKIGNWVRVEIRDANGNWSVPQGTTVTLPTATTVTGKTIDGSGWASSDVIDPTITITPAPPSSASLNLNGEDTVRITFAPFSMEELDTSKYKGFYNEAFVNLLSSPSAALQNNRMFLAEKYKVYYSDVSDPFTISDLAWFDVDSEVIGFTKSNSYLAVLAKDDGRSTIFLASEESRVVDSQTGATETYFAVKESNSGIGAIAPKCIATLSDEPMFLSKTGVFGILSNWQSEKYAVNRSSRINRRLCKEPDLNMAVGIAHNDYLYLAINGRMYVLDGRHKESDRAGNKPLEAYFFEGLPVIENMYVIDDKMYFTDGISTYTWNEDLSETERYIDNARVLTADVVYYQISTSRTEPPTGEWLEEKPTPQEGEYLWYKVIFDDSTEEITLVDTEIGDKRLKGEAVRAKWCSTFDDDGIPQKLKTLMKKGSMVTLVPHYKSGCEITLVKDGDIFQYLGEFNSGLQTFENIDFTQFSFNSNTVAFDFFTKKKIKKYKRLQIQIENNKAEPFGLTQITKTYTIGNYAKR